MKRLFGIFFSLAVIAMGLFFQFFVNGQSKRCTVDVQGTVIGYEQSESDEGSITNRAVVTYSYNNKNYEEVSSVGTGSKPYADGQEVTVSVNPDNPYEFIIEGETKIFSYVTWGMIILGILMLLADIFKIIRYGLV